MSFDVTGKALIGATGYLQLGLPFSGSISEYFDVSGHVAWSSELAPTSRTPH